MSDAPGHVLPEAEYRAVVDEYGRSDPAYQGALRMVVLADQVLRILGKSA